MKIRLCAALLAAIVALQATPAFATGMPYWVLGRQYSKEHAGIVSRVWAYNWILGTGGSHVSSLYVDADGYGGNQNRYVEAGLYKSYQMASGGDQRPVFFTAYEDYPYTSTQVIDYHQRLTLDTWHDVKIANFQPYMGAPPDWCAYINGTIKLNSPELHFYIGQPITASERKTGADTNYSSFDNVANRLITGSHSEWTSIKFEDMDSAYKPLLVNGSQWRCILQ